MRSLITIYIYIYIYFFLVPSLVLRKLGIWAMGGFVLGEGFAMGGRD